MTMADEKKAAFYFKFYPGDYLRDTQNLSEKAQVAYDRIMCEHMRNICLSYAQHKFFTKRLNEEEREELLQVLEDTGEGFVIRWVVDSIHKARAYSKSRSKIREGKTKKKDQNHMISYDNHMESNSNSNSNTVIKKTKKDKPAKEPKIEYAPDVKLTEAENQKLTDEYGFDLMNRAYTYLANYKIEKAYKTKSDYHTILRWVIDAVKNKGNGQQSSMLKQSKPLTGAQILLRQLNQSVNGAGEINFG